MSYYELKESLLCAAQELQSFGYTVDNFPLYQYYKDEHDKQYDYINLCISKIKQYKPDVIIFWFYGVPVKVFAYDTLD